MIDRTRPEDYPSALERIDLLQAAFDELHSKYQAQEQQIEWMRRQIFGPRSEKTPLDSPNQLGLGFSDQVSRDPEPEPPAPADPSPGPGPRRKGHGRRRIPDNLPVQRETNGPKACERKCQCHDEPMRCARIEVTRKIEYQPAKVFVMETHTEIAVCAKAGDELRQEPSPPSIIEKGLAAPSLLIYVIIAKYLDHLPLYRIQRILSRLRLPLPRSTLAGWVWQVAEAVRPIYAEIERQILQSGFLQSDDTPVRVLREKGGAFTGRVWVWRDILRDQVIYRFAQSRAGINATEFLAGWKGRLQTDDYAGYDAVYSTGDVIQFGCWAHARRKVFDSISSEPWRARQLLEPVNQLFAVERDLTGLSAEERKTARNERSAPILSQIETLCLDYEITVLPRSPLGVAAAYIRKNWKPLKRFVADGDAPIHNNAVENAIRPLAVGRKNWLFAGSPRGGETAAILFTLIENCKRAGIGPEEYLRDILERLPTHRNRQIGELTPQGWKAAREKEAAAASSLPAAA